MMQLVDWRGVALLSAVMAIGCGGDGSVLGGPGVDEAATVDHGTAEVGEEAKGTVEADASATVGDRTTTATGKQDTGADETDVRSPGDVGEANGAAEDQLPAAVVRTTKSPTIDGDLLDWQYNSAVHEILDKRKRKVGSFKLASDDTHLYAAFSVVDGSPMKNTSGDLEEILKGGDAVGLCFGPSGTNRSHQRLLAAEVNGTPVLIAYRPDWSEKQPHTFSSPVGETTMDFVAPLEGARVAFERSAEGYTSEWAVPWESLNLTPGFAGGIAFDSQIIFSDPSGTVNADTAWWHAKGGPGFTTEDLPTEARLYPATWGELRFFDEDPGPRTVAFEDDRPDVGLPITFELKKAGKTSLLVTDSTGFIVRELLRAEHLDAGIHTIRWNGRDRYDEPLPPGDYTWRLATFEGMGTRFHGSVGNSARPPFRTADGKGSMGGQHGGPRVLAADAHGVYIIGGPEEGHPAMRKVDREGDTLWKRSMGGFGVGKAVASDGKHAYLIHQKGRKGALHLHKLEIETGKDVPFSNAESRIPIGERTEDVGGMAVIGDVVYYALPERDRIETFQLSDATVGEPIRIDAPRDLAATGDGRLLIAAGDAVQIYDPASGESKKFVSGLVDVQAIACSSAGQVYLADRSEAQQILVYDLEDGRRIGTLGKKGGRPATEMAYDKAAIQSAKDLAVGGEGDIWAIEAGGIRRVVRFSPAGTAEMELFGPVAYNSFGPDLDAPSMVFYKPGTGKDPTFVQVRVDYDEFQADPERGATDAKTVEAVIRFGQDGVDYEDDLVAQSFSTGYGHVAAFEADNGHRYIWRIAKHNRATQPPGAALCRWVEDRWVPAAFVSNKPDIPSWSDTNQDGRIQEDERYEAPQTSGFAWLDRSLTLYGRDGTLSPSRVSDSGVPDYRDGTFRPYLDSDGEADLTGWVFNSMPDDEGAVYYAGNWGPHRHRTFWDRASENALVKVADGKVQWMVGNNNPYIENEMDMSTVSGVAGVVDDVVLVHQVEPANYLAFTTDGFSLGNVLLDENGERPRVGPTAIYIESFTGLFIEDPESGKRLLFSVSSGDDRILEVTGPGKIERREGTVTLESSFPREAAPTGETSIPYQTWWGIVGRGYGINGHPWEWSRESRGLAIHDEGAIIGDVRLRRDAGALHVLANVIDRDGYTAPASEGEAEPWGRVEGVELMLGPVGSRNDRTAQLGDVRVFLAREDDEAIAHAYRHGADGWKPIEGAKVAVLGRFHNLGWRLEAELPMATFPELAQDRLQTYKRGEDNETFEETLPDLSEPIRLNAAFHLREDDVVRRIPWVDDEASLEMPGRLNPASWGLANALASLTWPDASGVNAFALFRAPAENPAEISLVRDDLAGRRFVDTPGPGAFQYWLAPRSASGMGQPVGPVSPVNTRAEFLSFPSTRVQTLDDLTHVTVPRPSTVGMANVSMNDADSLRVTSSPGIEATAKEFRPGIATLIVQIPEDARVGSAYPVTIEAVGDEGPLGKTIHVIVGVDVMAELPRGSMPAPGDGGIAWKREPAEDADENPKHIVNVRDNDVIQGPSIFMEAWNSNNQISYPIHPAGPAESWEASGWFRLISRSGGTTSGIRINDREGRPIAQLHFQAGKSGDKRITRLTAQGQPLVDGYEEYEAMIPGFWQPFEIRAESGTITMTYGSGTRRKTVEAPPLEGSAWNQPDDFQVYQEGRTSVRRLEVGALRFSMIPEAE